MIMFSAFFITFLQVFATKMLDQNQNKERKKCTWYSLALSLFIFLFLSVFVGFFFLHFWHFLLSYIKKANELDEREAACCKWA